MPALILVQALIMSACDGSSNAAASGIAKINNPGLGNGSSAPSLPAQNVESCKTDDPEHICIGLKYVAYTDTAGAPSATQAQALELTRNMNQVWAQCNIGFQVEIFQAVNPVELGLLYNTGGFGDQDAIRAAFQDDSHFVIVATGPWNRGNNAVAWTSMPGGKYHGVVADHQVADDTNVIAHELGHYMNLDHVSNSSDLLNPIVYASSKKLSAGQCETARKSARGDWPHMSR